MCVNNTTLDIACVPWERPPFELWNLDYTFEFGWSRRHLGSANSEVAGDEAVAPYASHSRKRHCVLSSSDWLIAILVFAVIGQL